MRIAGAILMGTLTLSCESERKAGGDGAQTAAPAPTESTPQPLAPPQPSHAGPQANPMGAYTPDVVAKYDARTACLAICAAGLRCRSNALFGGGSAQVAGRLSKCRKGCAGAYAQRPGYLEEARTCLSSGACDRFDACVAPVLPSE